MNTKHIHLEKNSDIELNQFTETKSEVKPSRVNMNSLVTRFKKEKAKERKETIIFVSLACALVIISGVIVSL